MYPVNSVFIFVLNSNHEKHNYHKLISFKDFHFKGIDANSIFIVHFKQTCLGYPQLKGLASKETDFTKTCGQLESERDDF